MMRFSNTKQESSTTPHEFKSNILDHYIESSLSNAAHVYLYEKPRTRPSIQFSACISSFLTSAPEMRLEAHAIAESMIMQRFRWHRRLVEKKEELAANLSGCHDVDVMIAVRLEEERAAIAKQLDFLIIAFNEELDYAVEM